MIGGDGGGGPQDFYDARHGARWYRHPPQQAARAAQHNICNARAGPSGDPAKAATTPLDAFNLFLTDAMIDSIVVHSNEEGVLITDAHNARNPAGPVKTFVRTTPVEIRAFIGLCITRGVYRDYGVHRHELWSEQHGRPIYKATMSKHRFDFLIRILRFDDKTTRPARLVDDQFSPIRELFNTFNDECSSNFTLSEFVTIDETLRRFRGRCRFKLYMPQKPGKYGILFRVMTNANYRLVQFNTCFVDCRGAVNHYIIDQLIRKKQGIPVVF